MSEGSTNDLKDNCLFFDSQEKQTIDRFLKEGYIIFPLENRENLESIQQNFYNWGVKHLRLGNPPKKEDFFNEIHNFIQPNILNDFRMNLINKLNKSFYLKPMIYRLAKKYIHWIVGNELAMQRNCNLSIQMPNDATSLLPIHSDVWSGNSPYEVVFWLPLVSCYRTKSMFVLPKTDTERVLDDPSKVQSLNSERLFHKIRDDVSWLEVPYGHGVIFTHTLLHGNRINREPETRWTLNIRFKSLLSPYNDKGLGESFLPITVRPATRIGYHYKKFEA